MENKLKVEELAEKIERERRKKVIINNARVIAAFISLISCFRVMATESYRNSYFSNNDVAQITLETYRIIQIGMSAVLFVISIKLIIDIIKDS